MDPFRTRFILVDNSYAQRRRIVRTDDALTVVEQSIEDDSNESICDRAEQLELCPSTLQKELGVLTKFYSGKNWSRTISKHVARLATNPDLTKTNSLAIKLTFDWLDMLKSKIVTFGVIIIHKLLLRCRFLITKKRIYPNFRKMSNRLTNILGKKSARGTRILIFGIWEFKKLWSDFNNFYY